MKLDAITAEDMAGQVEELLGIKYRDPRTARLLAKLLGGSESKVIAILIGNDEAIVIQLWTDRFAVTTDIPPRSDLRITIPFKDLMTLFMGGLPTRSLLGGKIRFWGSPALGMRLRTLFHVELADPHNAAVFFRHYFTDD